MVVCVCSLEGKHNSAGRGLKVLAPLASIFRSLSHSDSEYDPYDFVNCVIFGAKTLTRNEFSSNRHQK